MYIFFLIDKRFVCICACRYIMDLCIHIFITVGVCFCVFIAVAFFHVHIFKIFPWLVYSY